MALTRRTFLALGAGFVLTPMACGGSDDDATPTGTAGVDGSGTGGTTGDLVIVTFFPDGILAAGQPQRIPIGLGDGDGVLTTGGPERLPVTILDSQGATVAETEAVRHADDLPRPYWPVAVEIGPAGVYTLRVDTGDGVADAAFSITDPAQIPIPKPGDAMVAVETPTTGDGRGVDPICTQEPFCPLHDLTLTEALQGAQPVAFLIATPAFCQTAACGPVLDVLVAQQPDFPDIAMVHAEVYTDTTIETTSPAVKAYRLPFEPVLFLAGADGVIRSRLDSIFDGAEVREALSALA